MLNEGWKAAYSRLLMELPELAARARPLIALTSACVDARVHLADAPSGAVNDPSAAALLDLLRGRAAAGTGGEFIFNWADGPAWLERNLPVSRSWGGTGPHAAMALTAIGAPSLTALEDRSAHMLAVVPGEVPLAGVDGPILARDIAPKGERRPEVFIIEYTAGQPIAGFTPPRSSRIILRFGDLGLEADPAFDQLSRSSGLGAGAALVAGFQCVPREKLAAEYDRVSDLIMSWRLAGVRTIHLELAGYEKDEDCLEALERMVGYVNSVGMSESEFSRYFGEGDLGGLMLKAAKDFHLERLCVHADHWAATVTRSDPDRERLALLTGCLLAAARAEAGRAVNPQTLPAAAQIAELPFRCWNSDHGNRDGWSFVACPSIHLPKPSTTLGMGDTFTGGCLLVLGLDRVPADLIAGVLACAGPDRASSAKRDIGSAGKEIA